MRNRQLGEHSQIKAKIIGENLDFQTKLGLDNLRYILSGENIIYLFIW